MSAECVAFEGVLPPEAQPAVAVVRTLVAAGFEAYLAGGCVRDLLLGTVPQDYDVATSAPPERVTALFRRTRQVGAAFGVVLVQSLGRWVEVATFREDGDYHDGRRPAVVHLSDARHDAARRDFTVNGMFLDPQAGMLHDYVGGRADLVARRLSAIGNPAARFAEDHLRLLRAVRFAARLGFVLAEPTAAAILQHAPRLTDVAAERVRDELQRMLTHPSRAIAWALLGNCGLRPYLWPGAQWAAAQAESALVTLEALPANASFELSLAVLLSDRGATELEQICRALTLSNDERAAVLWLVAQQAACDDPAVLSLAELKRLCAHPHWLDLWQWMAVRLTAQSDGAARYTMLRERIAAIAPQDIAPAPWITGSDLLAAGLTAGPAFKDILNVLYTAQLNEELPDRSAALQRMEALVAEFRRGMVQP